MRNFITRTIHHDLKENEMGRTCNTNGANKNCMEHFCEGKGLNEGHNLRNVDANGKIILK
jgi:hypothetical protein